MTIIAGRGTPNPRRAMFYLGAEGKNAERRVLHVTGLDLDRTRFTSANKEEVKREAAYVAAQAELFVETVPANRKARRKAAAEARRQGKREGKPAARGPKARNTWYGASLNPPAGVEVGDEDFLRGRYFLIDTVFRRYDGDRRGPVQEPAQELLVLHRKLVPNRNPLHAHYSGSLATARGTVIPIHYDAVNTAVAAARWAADRGWPGTCSHYTVAVEHRVRLHYPEAHSTVVEAMIRRAAEGQRVGAISADKDIRAMEPAELAHLIERRYRPRRDDADLEERISIYRLLDQIASSETEATLAVAGYRLALGDAQTKRGTPVYLVQPTERDDKALRTAISLHRVVKAGLLADGIYDRIGERMGTWIDARVAGLSPRPIRDVRRDLEQGGALAPGLAPISPPASTNGEPTAARLTELRNAAIRVYLPAGQALTPYRDGRVEIDQQGFLLLPRGTAVDHASLRRSDAETHEALARLILARRADDHAIEITGPRQGPHRIQHTVVALAANGVDPARISQLRSWPDLAARSGQAFAANIPEAPNSNAPPGGPPAAPPGLNVEAPPAHPPAPDIPSFTHSHLNDLEASVRLAANAGDLPAAHRDLVVMLSADWESVRRPHADQTVEAGRRAIREGVGVTLVALVRAEAVSAPAGSPARVLAEDAISEVSSSARAQRPRFNLDAVQEYLVARGAGMSVDEACRAAGPVETSRGEASAIAAALRHASAPVPVAPKFAAALGALLREEPAYSGGNVSTAPPIPAGPSSSGQSAGVVDAPTVPPSTPPTVPTSEPIQSQPPAAAPAGPADTDRQEKVAGQIDPAAATAPQPAPLTPDQRSKVVRALNDREDAVERRKKSAPFAKALRLAPDITVNERQDVRRRLIERIADENHKPSSALDRLNATGRLSGLRAIVRHTEAAKNRTKNAYEAAALSVGLETAQEAYRVAAAGDRRPAELKKIARADHLRTLDQHAAAVRMHASQLALDLPQLRQRVAAASAQRGSTEDSVAAEGALALVKLREKSKPADDTARLLHGALRDLENAHKAAREAGPTLGGYLPAERVQLTHLAYETGRAVAWVPPLLGDNRTVRRRVEDALDHKRLVAPPRPKAARPNWRLNVERGNAWNQQQNEERERQRQRARAQTSTTTTSENSPREAQNTGASSRKPQHRNVGPTR